MRKIGRVLAAGLVLLMVSWMLGGCARQSAKPEPAKEITFTFVNTVDIPSIDPAEMNDEASTLCVVNMYDPLLYPKVAEKSMEAGPHLAEKWDISPDGKTYTFYLRKGVKFHDGSELQAEDVQFSMVRMLTMKKGVSWLWSAVLKPENVKVIDPYTVQFVLNEPYSPFLASLTQLFIVNKDLITKNIKPGEYGDMGDYGKEFLKNADAGSGPYRFESWQRGSQLTMVKFPDYFKGWKPGQIDRVIYKLVPEEATVKMMLKSGEADMVNQWLTAETFAEFKKTPGVVVAENPSTQLFHIAMNTQKKPTDNKDLRLAVAYAFDYEQACRDIFNGAVQAQGPVPKLVWGHNDQVPVVKRDLAKAKEYLARSGYKPGQVTLDYVYVNTLPVEEKVGLLLQSNLQEIGIKVNVIGQPWVKMTEMATKPDTTPHMMALFISLRYPHPDAHTYGMYHPSSWGSYRAASWYKNDRVTEVLDKARRAVTPEEQLRYYREAQALVVEDMPSIYVANTIHRVAFRDWVKGYVDVGLLGYDLAFYNLTIEKPAK